MLKLLDPRLSSVTTAITFLAIHVLLLLLLVNTSHCQQHESSFSREDKQIIIQSIDQFFNDAISCSPHALTVAVVKDGRVFFAKGYGNTTLDPSTAKPVTSTTKFGLGSLTKAFTSLLWAKKVKESKTFDFDTPISKFVPDFRLVDDYRSEHASLRDVLGHRMAIPAYDTTAFMGLDPKTSREEFVRKLKYLKSPFSFREKFIYNNYMYIMAGDMLGRLSQGQSWESLVQDTIFKPLNMKNAGFMDRIQNSQDNFAQPRAMLDEKPKDVDNEAFKATRIAGSAGSIYASAEDMAKWMNFLLGNAGVNTSRLDVDETMVKMTFDPSILLNQPWSSYFKPAQNVSQQMDDYCMGWISGSYAGYRTYSHTGGILTYGSTLTLFPDINLGVFVVTSGQLPSTDLVLEFAGSYISNLFLGYQTIITRSDLCPNTNKEQNGGDQTTTAQPKFKCSADVKCNISDYTGTYSHPTFGDITISLDDKNNFTDILNFNYGESGWLKLTQTSRSHFEGQYYGPLWFGNPASLEFAFCDDEDQSKNADVGKSNRNRNQKCGGKNLVWAVTVDDAPPFYKQYEGEDDDTDGDSYNNGGHRHLGFSWKSCQFVASFVSLMTVMMMYI